MFDGRLQERQAGFDARVGAKVLFEAYRDQFLHPFERLVAAAFVEVAVIFVSPAPLPKKAPANRLFELVIVLTPEKVLEPAYVWLPLSSGILPESRASASVPRAILPALRTVSPKPLPVKVPTIRLLALVIVLTPLKVLEPEKV